MEKNEGEHKRRTKEDIEDLKNHRDCLSSQETIPERLEYKQVYDRDSRRAMKLHHVTALSYESRAHSMFGEFTPFSKSTLPVVFKLRPSYLTPSLTLSVRNPKVWPD
jgi:hypothetical protein